MQQANLSGDTKEIKECYTCKLKFVGYYNLMDHRKSSHPSNRKCRNYPGSCRFDTRCWYVHEDKVVKEQETNSKTPNSFTCKSCSLSFVTQNSLDEHMKIHTMKPVSEPSQNVQVFQRGTSNALPPDQMTKMFSMIQTLFSKMNKIEDKFEELLM